MHCFQNEYAGDAICRKHPCITLRLKEKAHVKSDFVDQTDLADDVADMLQWCLVPDLPCSL